MPSLPPTSLIIQCKEFITFLNYTRSEHIKGRIYSCTRLCRIHSPKSLINPVNVELLHTTVRIRPLLNAYSEHFPL